MSDHNHIQESLDFTDENGNKIRFNLESFVNGTGDNFQGYLVAPMAIQPDVDGENLKAAYDKIYQDAKRYFDEHPEQRPEDGASQEISYTTEYLRIQAENEIRKRVSEGNASRLQQAYVHQMDTKVGQDTPQMGYAWEQLNGGMSLDASEDEVASALRRDMTAAAMKQQRREADMEYKVGEALLRARANTQETPTGTIQTGDVNTQIQQPSQRQTLTKAEAAALINRQINKER